MKKWSFVFTAFIFLFFGNPVRGQVKIARILSDNQITPYHENHLVLIDFWATWCAPCINIGKQLEVTQEIYKNDLTIISLSNENEAVVRKFIEKHHPRLTIAIDDRNQTFQHYGVTRSLPFSVLLNQKGRVLWRGHPADLSNGMIDRFIRENRGVGGKEKPSFISITEEIETHPIVKDKDVFSVELSRAEESYFIVSEGGIQFQGKSSRLFSEILKNPIQAIRVENDPVVKVEISKLNWEKDPEEILGMLLIELKMFREIATEPVEFYLLTVKNRKLLWDDKQISLGSYNGYFMVDDDNLSIDNATVRDFSFRVSAYLDHPVYTDYDSPLLHDWLVHYKFFNLCREQLASEYGIHIELKKGKHEVNIFRQG